MRLVGVTIPDNKKIGIALTYVYGIGSVLASRILKEADIDTNIKAVDLKADQQGKLKEVLEHYKIEGELRREILLNVKRLKDIGSWRGTRHTKRLPVRGQTTRTNMRTVKGNTRKTMGSGRKPSATPT
jgi:small subunit ribosomal protein S13